VQHTKSARPEQKQKGSVSVNRDGAFSFLILAARSLRPDVFDRDDLRSSQTLKSFYEGHTARNIIAPHKSKRPANDLLAF